MIIAPQKPFLVDYKINNPADTAQHWVRAVIKNSISGATIDTLDLTDNGSGYFSEQWITPADMTGSGLQIVIFRTVYDDSGYTTESVMYGTTIENFIVRDLASTRIGASALGAGGARGDLIDYKKIRNIIEEVVAGKIKEIKPDHSKVIQEIGKVGEKVEGIQREFVDSRETITNELQGVTERVIQGIEDADRGDEVKDHVEEKMRNVVTIEQFTDFINQMQDFFMNLVGIEEKSRKEIKDLFERLASSVEAKVAEPVQIEFKTPTMETQRREPEQKQVNPREAIFKSLLTA